MDKEAAKERQREYQRKIRAGRTTEQREAVKEYQRKYQAAMTTEQRKAKAERDRKRREERTPEQRAVEKERTRNSQKGFIKRVIGRIRQLSGCARCGYQEHPAGLAFHHVQSGDKIAVNAASVVKFGWKQVFAELSKTIVLCHTCHHVLHSLYGHEAVMPPPEFFQQPLKSAQLCGDTAVN